MEVIFALLMSIVIVFQTMFPGITGGKNTNYDDASKIMPETWAAVDGLGRTLPSAEQVGEKDSSKFVGLFYWTWHTNFAKSLTPLNATEILFKIPTILYNFEATEWMPEAGYPDGRPYFWDKPVWGYYRDTDEYVLRKNAELIADAGVDVIFFDCTNGTSTWDESCEKLFEVFEKAKADGVNVPKVAYILPFSADEDTTTSLKHLYSDIYSKGRYKDLWFMWDGKPMIMAHSSQLDRFDKTESEILNFFTFRKNEPTYFASDTWYKQKTWGWCSDYKQTKFGRSLNGHIEQMCVSVAQNAADGELVAMSADRDDVQGRSFTHGDYSYTYSYAGKEIKADKNVDNSLLYGLNFQQQWDYAIKCDPDFIFVTGWNEWIAGRWKEWGGTPNAFPDQFSPEFSRDIEPSDGILKDYYYYQLVANIRRFKGISSSTIENNGVKEYYHYTGSTPARNSDGWVGVHFEENTMRNDFVSAKVHDDGKNIYLTIETKDDITPYTDNAWMRIFIDSDTSGISPNWEGFEYVINRTDATENTVIIEKSKGGWEFEQVGTATYKVDGSKMEIVIPASALNMEDNVSFNFKLSDNMQTDGEIMDFYKSGDVAPGGRFTFVY